MFENREILEMCQVLAEKENLRVTVNESIKCGIATGFGAVAGGIVAGPVGVAIGGTLTSLLAAWGSKNKFRSAVDVLRNDLTPVQKRKLIANISAVLSSVRPEDYIRLVSIVLTSASLKEVVLKELCAFFMKEMNLRIM